MNPRRLGLDLSIRPGSAMSQGRGAWILMQTTAIEPERDSGRIEPEFSEMDPAKEPPSIQPAWAPVQSVLFRFLFTYFVLYIFPFPVDGDQEGAYANLWNAIVTRV